MAQGYKGEIPFADLCHRIYEGFGQWAVIALVFDRQRAGCLQDIEWADCTCCEEWMPFENKDCLICGQERRSNG